MERLITNLDHGKFGRPGPPIQAFGEVSLIHLLPLQPSLQLGGALRANLDQCRLQSGADGADLAPDRFSGPQEPPEIGGGGQGVAAGKELLPAIEMLRKILYVRSQAHKKVCIIKKARSVINASGMEDSSFQSKA